MNDVCWYCEKHKYGYAIFSWEVPCECGTLNFAKAHPGCHYTERQNNPLCCKGCNKELDFSNRKFSTVNVDVAPKDEEDIT